MTETLEITACVVDAVQPIHRRYRRYVSRDDLMQELWLYVHEHPDAVARLLTSGRGFLVRRLRTAAERYARKEKAAGAGYSPEDEAFYSLRALRELMPDALDSGAVPSQQVQEVRVATSKGGYGDYEAGLVDVRRAVAQLPDDERHLLKMHYRYGYSPDRLGTYYSISTDAVYARLARVMRRVQRHLGGPNPYRREEN